VHQNIKELFALYMGALGAAFLTAQRSSSEKFITYLQGLPAVTLVFLKEAQKKQKSVIVVRTRVAGFFLTKA
jgi:hypothetical protein